MRRKVAVMFLSLLFSFLLTFSAVAPFNNIQNPEQDRIDYSVTNGSFSGNNSSYHNYYPSATLCLISNSLYPGNYFYEPGRVPFPIMMAFDPENNNIYISSVNPIFSTGCVFVVNALNLSVVDRITISSRCGGQVVYDPVNNEIYVAARLTSLGPAKIYVINPTSNSVSDIINVGASAFGEVIDPENNQLFVSHPRGDNITVINASTNTIYRNITLGSCASSIVLAYSPLTNIVYASEYYNNRIALINASNDILIGNLSVISKPMGLVYDPINRDLYVSLFSKVAIVNTTTSNVSGEVNFPGPSGLSYSTFDPSTDQIYLDGFCGEGIEGMNLDRNNSISTIQESDCHPLGLLYVPVNEEIVVAESGSSSLTIIKPVNASSTVYPIQFNETGLSRYAKWYVNGIEGFSSGPIERPTYIGILENGTYAININGPTDFFYSHTIKITVSGQNTTVNISFISKLSVYAFSGTILATVIVVYSAFLIAKRKRK